MPEPVTPPQGAEKVAVLLMALGEAAAAEILRHLGPKEVQAVGVAMAGLKKVPKQAVESTLNNFIQDVRNETALTVGSDEYIRNVLINALGEEKAGGMIDRILLGGNTKGLEALKWMDARAVVELIRYEHPQIIAIVLSYLDSDHAAEVLAAFPERQRGDILLRVATLDGVQPAALQELNEILEKQLRGGASGQSSSIGGIKAAANILNFIDGSVEAAVMEQLKSADEDLAQQIEDLMFVFDNLVDVDDRGIQTLLREITTDNLVLALKAADEPVKQKFFKNMSQRAAEMLREDLENRGPVRLSDVETAQKEIMTAARRLANAGQIVLGGAGGEKMV
jgi:flagellar motor switch protein FliG